ncbi:MAG: 5-formyltetrahydrofolate cyclo-ligase [Acidimicrobiales bacterium]
MTTPPGPGAPKTAWRRWAEGLPPVDRATTRRIVAHIDHLLAGIDGPVLAYVALQDEIPVDAIDAPPVLVLPRLGDDGTMTLHLDDGVLERHRYGIQQPPATALAVGADELAAVLVPGRIFDRDGYRLGRGGGHYDRLLPQLPAGIPVIGVTAEARLVDRLPREPHDRPMTHLVTERSAISTR